MATISLPSNFSIRQASGGYQHAQGVLESPYSLKRSVQNWGGKRRMVEIMVPPIDADEADNWTDFFEDLVGCVNTFNLDLRDIFPHSTGDSSVAFRLASPNIEWDISTAKHFGFSFQAVEVV